MGPTVPLSPELAFLLFLLHLRATNLMASFTVTYFLRKLSGAKTPHYIQYVTLAVVIVATLGYGVSIQITNDVLAQSQCRIMFQQGIFTILPQLTQWLTVITHLMKAQLS
jgi:hypothetical protein